MHEAGSGYFLGEHLNIMANTKKRLPIVWVIVGLTFASVIGVIFLFRKLDKIQAKIDGERLVEVVAKNYSTISFTESTFVFEERRANDITKSAEIMKLFFTERTPEDVCSSILNQLQAKNWKSYSGCVAMTYPDKRMPFDDLPSYTFYRLNDAQDSSGLFRVVVDVEPYNTWGRQFSLSTIGSREAIPLAKKQGKTFFVVSFHYMENPSTFGKYCNELNPSDYCGRDTFFSWEFADGRKGHMSW